MIGLKESREQMMRGNFPLSTIKIRYGKNVMESLGEEFEEEVL